MSNSTALYIHLPWCVRKCPYCDFNSHQHDKNSIPEAQYIAALKRDLAQEHAVLGNRTIHSVFFGGGTPSLFSAKGIAEILDEANRVFPFTNNAEITLEANPGTFEAEKFAGYRSGGVNRLSLGVQSFDDEKLKALGRIHNAGEARRAVSALREVGFDNFNIDIMHGLPNQSIDEALQDLEIALSLEPTHLSWYQLTIEPNTAFYSQPPVLPDLDTLDDIELRGFELLRNQGFEQYEVSAWSKPQRECRHNLSYWQFEDYIGIGAGAHGKVTLNNDSIRRQKTRTPEDYMRQGAPKTRLTESDTETVIFEYFLNRTRLFSPIELADFEQKTGAHRRAIEPVLHKLAEQQLVELDDHQIRLTRLGQRFLNNVQSAFLNN